MEEGGTQNWPCTADSYQKISLIGKGGFSEVWSVFCPSKDKTVSVKIMDLETISTPFEDILQEVQTMRLSENENILRCFCSFVKGDQLWLVTQLMDKGSCLRILQLSFKLGYGEGLTEDCVSYILFELSKGINYLHSNGQIHRDIKPGNVLLNAQGEVLLADFGVSDWTIAKGKRVDRVNQFVGTPCFMAPEVMEQAEGYDHRADIWSLGITALELAKGSAPYAHLPPMQVLVKTIEEDPPSLLSYKHDRQLRPDGPAFSKLFEDFYKKCLQKNPKQRASMQDLLKHKFFKGVERDPLVRLLNTIQSVGTEKKENPDDGLKSDRLSIEERFAKSDNDLIVMNYRSKSDPNDDDVTEKEKKEIAEQIEKNEVSFQFDDTTIDDDNNDDNEKENSKKMGKSESEDSFVPDTTWVFSECKSEKKMTKISDIFSIEEVSLAPSEEGSLGISEKINEIQPVEKTEKSENQEQSIEKTDNNNDNN